MSVIRTNDTEAPQVPADRVATGIEGLDDILYGGLAPHRLYLVEGHPGSGKTTLAMQFLMEGARLGEPTMLVTLSEDENEIRASAESHGWNIDGIHIQEILASEDSLKPEGGYTMYHPSEVELAETTKAVLEEAEKIKPTRLVFDSLSELRLLAGNPLRYRRQILALKQYFSRHRVTVLFIDDRTGDQLDMDLHSLAHGVVSLDRLEAEYGSTRRRLHIGKLRGRSFREGYHDFVIRRGGIHVFPRLVAAEHRAARPNVELSSGLPAFDAMLGGGLSLGTSTLIIGAAGTGKSTLSTQFAVAAAARQDRSSIFLFDESVSTFVQRSAGLGMDIEPLIREDRLQLRQVDPAELSPGEFAYSVRDAVERDETKLVVIDSLNGYLNAMPSERFLTLHLHELLAYLGQKGVTTILLLTQHGFVGQAMEVPVDTSYLADSVILLRYFEARGEIRQAISVIKKRTGKHERTIRELRFDGGLAIGEPLWGFDGVLSGAPRDAAAKPAARKKSHVRLGADA